MCDEDLALCGWWMPVAFDLLKLIPWVLLICLSKHFFYCLRPMDKIIRHKEVEPGKNASWSLQVT